jgi:hypothetical protein
VRRGDIVAGLHRVDHFRRQLETAGAPLGHDRLEAHRREVILGGDPVTRPKLAEHLPDRLGVVAHPLQPATRQQLAVAA